MPIYSLLAISGNVYDIDESTALSSAELYAYNITKNTSISYVVVNGEYTVNLANLSSGWDANDEIRVEVITDDGRVGFFVRTIVAGDTVWDVNIYVQYISSMNSIIQEHGEYVTVKSTSVSTDSTGHTTEIYTSYEVLGIPLLISDTSVEFKEGVLNLGDLSLFVSYNDSNKQYCIVDNLVVFDIKTYRIQNVIKEKGLYKGKFSHYELFCRKID